MKDEDETAGVRLEVKEKEMKKEEKKDERKDDKKDDKDKYIIINNN